MVVRRSLSKDKLKQQRQPVITSSQWYQELCAAETGVKPAEEPTAA